MRGSFATREAGSCCKRLLAQPSSSLVWVQGKKLCCLVRWRLGCGRIERTDTLLCVVLSSDCTTLVVWPIAWRSFLFMLNHLSARYFAMRHINISARQVCDMNRSIFNVCWVCVSSTSRLLTTVLRNGLQRKILQRTGTPQL